MLSFFSQGFLTKTLFRSLKAQPDWEKSMKKTLALVLFLILLLSGFIALFAVAMDDDPPVKSM